MVLCLEKIIWMYNSSYSNKNIILFLKHTNHSPFSDCQIIDTIIALVIELSVSLALTPFIEILAWSIEPTDHSLYVILSLWLDYIEFRSEARVNHVSDHMMTSHKSIFCPSSVDIFANLPLSFLAASKYLRYPFSRSIFFFVWIPFNW